jgi:hypothetical protein
MYKYIVFLIVSITTLSFAKATVGNLEQLTKENAVVILVDSSKAGTRVTSQTITVFENGHVILVSPVSTGIEYHGDSPNYHNTPTATGKFKPISLSNEEYLGAYHKTLKNVIRFSRSGLRIYGLENAKNLGTQATHGGIKTSMDVSAKILDLVRANSRSTTLVVYK